MFKLDDNLLRELGLGSLPPAEKNRMLGHIYETLEMRVGMTLANQMTDAQLSEFESFIDGNDEAGALKWLESNFPNYKQVVADELEKLKVEIKAAAPQIVAASQQAQAQMGPPQPPAGGPPPQQPQYPPSPAPAPAPPPPMPQPAPAAPAFEATQVPVQQPEPGYDSSPLPGPPPNAVPPTPPPAMPPTQADPGQTSPR